MHEHPKTTYFMCIDSDAFLLDFSLEKMQHFLKRVENYSVIISKDMPPWGNGEFNAGCFIVKNDAIGKHIMNYWMSLYNASKWSCIDSKWKTDSPWAGEDYEQGSFTKFIWNNPHYKQHIAQLPYYTLNNNCDGDPKKTITVHLADDFKSDTELVNRCINNFIVKKEKFPLIGVGFTALLLLFFTVVLVFLFLLLRRKRKSVESITGFRPAAKNGPFAHI